MSAWHGNWSQTHAFVFIHGYCEWQAFSHKDITRQPERRSQQISPATNAQAKGYLCWGWLLIPDATFRNEGTELQSHAHPPNAAPQHLMGLSHRPSCWHASWQTLILLSWFQLDSSPPLCLWGIQGPLLCLSRFQSIAGWHKIEREQAEAPTSTVLHQRSQFDPWCHCWF